MTEYLFVYGTLRPATGHPRSHLLAFEEPVGPARIRGRLYDAGPYPAVVLSDDPTDVVLGDLVLLKSPDRRLPELDQEEGCPPETAPSDGLFRREVTTVVTEDGRSLKAWVYTWTRAVEPLVPVPSGDYVRHLENKKKSL